MTDESCEIFWGKVVGGGKVPFELISEEMFGEMELYIYNDSYFCFFGDLDFGDGGVFFDLGAYCC
jgi:hypothetical protein